MLMEQPPLPGGPRGTSFRDWDILPARAHGPSGVRQQAAWIVEHALADGEPEQASARELLREHLAAHPGRPEIALAEHLLAIRPGMRPHTDDAGSGPCIPGASEPVSRESMGFRLGKALQGRMLVTAFQPITELSTGIVVGVEAFTRFVSDGGDAAGEWFAAAAEAQLERELEFAALESALTAALGLPAHLFLALKVSPATCLDPLLPGLLEESMSPMGRVVLELTEALTPEQLPDMVAALAPMRRRGVRLAVGRIGSYSGSISHIRLLRPDILKLDRGLVAEINTDAGCTAFGEAMTAFADDLGAVLIAEGIETEAELAAVAGFSVTAGQGYYLGRPSVGPRDWAGWNAPVGASGGALVSRDP